MTKLDLPKNKSIVILSSPRTGSTVLGQCVEKIVQHKFFNEPSIDPKTLNKFYNWKNLNKKFILKEHARFFLTHYTDEILENTFVIRLQRKNVFEQVLSNYVALLRKQFVYTTQIAPDLIVKDEKRLLENLDYIQSHNKITLNLKCSIDLDLSYEDLNLTDSYETLPTPKPINNEELINWAKNCLKDKL